MKEEMLGVANKLTEEIRVKSEGLVATRGELRLHRIFPNSGSIEYINAVRPEVMVQIKAIAVTSLENDIASLRAQFAAL